VSDNDGMLVGSPLSFANLKGMDRPARIVAVSIELRIVEDGALAGRRGTDVVMRT
jgi:hypothetical protein